MASPFFLLLISLSIFISSSKGGEVLYQHRHVCDTDRYQKLGLDLSKFAFCDKSLSFSVRAKHLIGSMTLQEKIKQLGHRAPGVERLGIPKYNWWSEALHGVSNVGGGSSFDGPLIKAATSFPTPITTGAAFNETLWKAIGEATSTEARAMHNHGVGGLTYWSPNINIVRDPRWGRTMETPGEDPYSTGVYAVNFVRGLQDVKGIEDPKDPNTRPLKVSACCKHYAAYDVDYWKTSEGQYVERELFNSNVTERDMVESFLRPFEMCVKEGDVSSVMCSYNNVNGIPTCADPKLLKGTIREDWGLNGYIVSDCDSIKTIVEKQRFMDDTQEDAVAQVMLAGLDMDCGEYYPKHLERTLDQGMIKESDVDRALLNNYMVLLRLGWFDKIEPLESLNATSVCSKAHLDLALDAARQGIVLLKNENDILPLKNIKKLAVVGPHANATSDMIGNYAGVPCRYVSPIDGLKKYFEVDYQPGCADVKCHNESFLFNAERAAKNADATVIIVGLNQGFEKESLDRTDLELPGYQNELIKRVATQAKGPVVLVLMTAGGVNVTDYVKKDGKYFEKIKGVLWAGYPGQEGGQAVADVIFGKYNPGGRLPITWYPADYVWKLPMTSLQFRPNDELGYPGRTYKFYNETPIFPFGHGLSYTKFSYEFVAETQKSVTKNLGCSAHCQSVHYNEVSYTPSCQSALISDLDCHNDVTIEVKVSNTGNVDGSDVVMLYSKPPKGIMGAPIKQLVGFKRVFVKAGGSEVVKFEMNSCKHLVFVTETAYEVVPSGEHVFSVGDKQMAFQVYFKKDKF